MTSNVRHLLIDASLRLACAVLVWLATAQSFLGVVAAQSVISIAPRSWSINGEDVEAVFISMDDETVRLHRMSDNEKVAIPLAQFSKADQDYLAELTTDAPLPVTRRKVKQRLAGVVTKIIDGDTFEVTSAGRRSAIRLYGIDAPELRQPFGAEARRVMIQACLRQYVEAEIYAHDDYGRAIAAAKLTRLADGEKDIALEMVRHGCAWSTLGESNQDYAAAAADAKQAKIGLWQEGKPMAPWRWRAEHGR